MKNKIIIGSLISLVLVGLVYMMLNTNSDQQNSITNKLINLNPDEGIMCTQAVSVGGDKNSVTSTIYILGKKMRYDSSLAQEVQGQKDIHMITDGEYSYLWGKGIIANTLSGGGSNKGFKMKMDDKNESFTPNINIEDLKKNNFNVPGLKCQTWNSDKSLLEIPTDIDFVSMENMMNPAMMNLKSPKNNQSDKNISGTNLCEMCNMIPDAQGKKDCLESCKDTK